MYLCDAVEAHSCVVIYEMSLVEQDTTVINKKQDVSTRKQSTKTFGSKRPAFD